MARLARSTKAQIAELERAIYTVARREAPVSVRGVFYRVMSMGLVPKSEQGYGQVQRRVLLMRRSGALPYRWIADGSRISLKPNSYHGLSDCLERTAAFYRRELWSDQGVHVEVWTEKDALRGVIYPVTAQYDVPLLISRGFASESFLWSTAEEIKDDEMPSVIYQLGDHDPSGVDAWPDTRSFVARRDKKRRGPHIFGSLCLSLHILLSVPAQNIRR